MTTLRARRNLEPNLAAIANAAEQAGRGPVKPYTVALTSGCVLREGESLTSDRVVAQLGPSMLVGCTPHGRRVMARERTLGCSLTPT